MSPYNITTDCDKNTLFEYYDSKRIKDKIFSAYLHLITIEKLSGKGESWTYSEQFMVKN